MLNIKNLYSRESAYAQKIQKVVGSFGLTEKLIFILAAIGLTLSSFTMLLQVNNLFTKTVPAHGGSLVEGIVGTPRFINPLLELSDADRDLTYLVYSGLMRATPTGDLIPDLAESYTVSPDGLIYTFKIKDNIHFHDGTKVTTDDIEYTITQAQDIGLRSPKRTNWVGVTIKKISDTEISFELAQPYSPFLENTTLGILPKHIWAGADVDAFPFSPYNTNPVGSGPYKISQIIRNDSGIPTSYEMQAFSKYALGEPFITNLKLNFYTNEKSLLDAYSAKQIDSTSSLSPQNLSTIKDSVGQKEKISLPRIFGVFFNQNQNKIFLNKEVRTALNMTVDKNRIINEVLGGYGQIIDSPIPNGIITEDKPDQSYNKDQAIKEAQELLSKNGWIFNESEKIWEKKISKKETQKLAFSLSTSNTTDLKNVAEILKQDWNTLGAQIEIETFDPSDLNQNVIGQRKYDSLLFGQIVGRSLDLFAFWHSSQRNSGYNVAIYTNSKADKLLEEARQISDKAERLKKYTAFETEVKNDIPAIFIYTPEFIYLLPVKIKGFDSGLINNRSERFENIYQWFIETDSVWKFLN